MREGRSREIPAWQHTLAEAMTEALPRLLEAPADPLLLELIAALTAALCRGEVEIALAGEAPEGVSADPWPDGHRQALIGSCLSREPDGPLALTDGRLSWRRWKQRQERVLAALLRRVGVQPPPLNLDAPDSEGAAAAAAPPQAAADAVGAVLPQEPAAGTRAATSRLASPPSALPTPAAEHATPESPERVAAALEPLLQGLDGQQRRAVLAALRHRLVLILGGPGTGKTSTVARLLAAVRQEQPGVRVHLAAPTGKAAARLRAATAGGEECSTLHRLLESRGDGFGRDRRRPLELDLLVIDEMSMVDLELMEAVLEALPETARLVLVGDPAQLPPIAPGAVLLLLQEPALVRALAPVRCELRTTYRNDGAIARVAASLRAIPAPGALAGPSKQEQSSAPVVSMPLRTLRPLLEQLAPSDNLVWEEAGRDRLPPIVLERLRAHQRTLAGLASRCWPGDDDGWAQLLAERDRLLVLSPIRRGRWGIDAIHRALLGRPAPVSQGGGTPWVGGTPLLCRRNLPALGLANGDIGVLVARGGGGGEEQRVLFGQEAPLWLHPAQLGGALEPALALTVHKAQGSEAAEVVVLLEETDAVDPRLLYTALTRARQRALLITAPERPGGRQD